ncbi:methyl-accepting chemotaxis sensory transducer [Leptolyngbya sp. Heron Island J]|uniref:methyl-accepting chemotaxis protein n=1 Tax=Leptolyngbya sp. Heron Island J TaxID=1385935 RepID=UPI0003B94858|nr:methyl-accepting chemotaxis protein [Leptolyngbya sp. Heron Island J]ESA32817.1 methyl-accepting chemotaxis sensory transducer [Leptolyngbya sp. Heron Island J]
MISSESTLPDQLAHPQSSTTNAKTTQTGKEHKQAKLKKGSTLTNRLLTFVLPTTLIPLVVAGALGFRTVKQKAQAELLQTLRVESTLAAEAATTYIEDTLKLPEVIALSPPVLQALKTGGQKAAAQELHTKPIDQVEKEFSAFKLLQPNATLNQYLRDVVKAEGFGEIFFTERHGLNIAYSHPTSDFVQRDEIWWQRADQKGQYVGSPELDASSGVLGIPLSQAIRDPSTGDFLGVIKALTPTKALNKKLTDILATNLQGAQTIQLLDTVTGLVFSSINVQNSEDSTPEKTVDLSQSVTGGEIIFGVAQQLDRALKNPSQPLEEITSNLRAEVGSSTLTVELDRINVDAGENAVLNASVALNNQHYSLTTIPGTEWVAVAVVDTTDVQAAGNDLLRLFGSTTLVLAVLATAVLIILSRQLAMPLQSLTNTAEAAAEGRLGVRARLAGTIETRTLGNGFNQLLSQIQSLLKQQQDAAAEQERQRESLENEISQLMEDVGDAADGDLRVRAQLSEGDVGIVADLFNSIIENLRLTTQQVKSSTGQVTSALSGNEVIIRQLATQAVTEAESLQDAMEAVEDISASIQEVATNAGEASQLTQATYDTAKVGTTSMDQTVDSILQLRSTVGETAKKIKRLGESAQKISQTVSLIDEIALKTNLLAVNASVEAARAGEMGEGFTAVAEQVGSLAEQSSSATKEIAKIVASIQTETQTLVESIETGTAQVVDSTNLVEATKERLSEVLTKSEQINQLMQQISASTQYQTESSAAVTELVKEVAQGSEKRSQSSKHMAQSIQETVQIAQSLQDSVEQFKLEDKSQA